MLRSKYALPTPALLLHESYITTRSGMQDIVKTVKQPHQWTHAATTHQSTACVSVHPHNTSMRAGMQDIVYIGAFIFYFYFYYLSHWWRQSIWLLKRLAFSYIFCLVNKKWILATLTYPNTQVSFSDASSLRERSTMPE